MIAELELTFHDSVPLEESALPEAREKAAKQKELVLSYFRDRFSMNFTPVEMHQIMTDHGEKILLNSVRRSITDLTSEPVGGKLVKCDWCERRMGAYGKANRTWRYQNNYIAPLNKK